MTLTVGIDLGTSGIKVAIVEDARRVVADASAPIAVSIPRIGWSEQDADLWVDTTFACLDRLAAEHPRILAATEGIGLSGQMLTALLLDADLRPLRPAILWNDQRAIAECDELLHRMPDIGQRSNGTPDPGITAPKLLWLARHEPRMRDRARMLMLAKDYVRLALTGEVATEPTDAGGTQLFDCARGAWDEGMCAAAGWDMACLPPVVPSWDAAGGLRPDLAARWGMRARLPVAAGAGDNMGSTLGAGGAAPGDAVLSIGTSGVSCIVDGTFHPGPEVAVLTCAHAVPGTFLSMGVVMTATAALDWAARLVGLSAAGLAAAAADCIAAGRTDDAPVFLPCLGGIRTPANRPSARGRMEGLHPGVDAGMLGYAVMEGIAFQMADCVEAQRAAGTCPRRFVVAGGGSRSALWVDLLAAALDAPLSMPGRAADAGCVGAAMLGASAAGQGPEALFSGLPVEREVEVLRGLRDALVRRKTRFDRLAEDEAVSGTAAIRGQST